MGKLRRFQDGSIREGQIEFLNDTTHALKGQTVPIPEWPEESPT